MFLSAVIYSIILSHYATTLPAGDASLSNTLSPSKPLQTPSAFPAEISLKSPSTFFKAAVSKDLEVWSSTSVASSSHPIRYPRFLLRCCAFILTVRLDLLLTSLSVTPERRTLRLRLSVPSSILLMLHD
ncbi:hypothetical protein GJ744_007076 [Endocarpon pusillum]|uniref:Secreted protein n=1 Tax=Endocarpon pusillum TaxID=364733 RepID=A0A8H7E5L1_9EURO|nr:hypothetical protein GJ744_007076 [Endocarpon pusillum]